MNKVLEGGRPEMDTANNAADWSTRMSNNVAAALLVYTALQIFVTTGAMAGAGMSVLPYLALVILVAGIIPACRSFERRWRECTQTDVDHAVVARRFRRDQILLWSLAIGLPLLITFLVKAVLLLVM